MKTLSMCTVAHDNPPLLGNKRGFNKSWDGLDTTGLQKPRLVQIRLTKPGLSPVRLTKPGLSPIRLTKPVANHKKEPKIIT